MIIMIKILGIDDFSEIYNKRLVNDFPAKDYMIKRIGF